MDAQVVDVSVLHEARVVDRSQVIYRVALFALLAGSLGLRLFGLGWGIPQFNPTRMAQSAYRNSYHIDEDNYIWGLMQMRPSEGNFDVVDYHWGTLQYFLIYGALLGGEAAGIIPSPWETAFRNGNIDAMPQIYELGRLVSVAASILGVLVVVALGTLVGGRMAGLGAGVAYAIAPLPVVEAHYLTSDVLVSVLVASVVLVSALAVKHNRLALLALAGLLLGLAITAKYSGIFVAPALLVAQCLAWRVRSTQYAVPSGGTRYSALRTWFLPWLAAAGGFLIGEPYALIVPDKLLAGIRSTLDGNAMEASWGLEPPFRMVTWQLGNLAWLGLTLPLALLALAGIIVLLSRHLESLVAPWRSARRPADTRWPTTGDLLRSTDRESSLALGYSTILLVAIASILVGLAMNRVFMLRYSQPLVPLLAVAAGVGWAAIPWPVFRWTAGALAVGVAGVITLGQLSIMAGPHPANDLLAWLDSHLKPGQQVARLSAQYPPLDGGDIRLIRLDPWRP